MMDQIIGPEFSLDFQKPILDFESLTDRFSGLIRDLNAGITSEPERVKSVFLTSDATKQEAFLRKVAMYIALVEGANAEQIPVIEDKRFIWYSLKRLGLVPPSGLFDCIETGDYVEIYDSKGIQTFANFEFCSLISYSIEETLMYTFEELYRRDFANSKRLMESFNRCFGGATGPFDPMIESHHCEEIFSPENRKATVKIKRLCPLGARGAGTSLMLVSSEILLKD